MQDENGCFAYIEANEGLFSEKKVEIVAQGGIFYLGVFQNEVAFGSILADAGQGCRYTASGQGLPR